MPIIQPKARALSVEKGNQPPLSSSQRRLIEIFVWYLRQLPEYREAEGYRSSSWDSDDYAVLNRLLSRFFLAKNPDWVIRREKNQRFVQDLPEIDADEYMQLMKSASTADDPRAKRRLDLLKMGRSKKDLFRFIKYYQEERAELGLPPDPTFSRNAWAGSEG